MKTGGFRRKMVAAILIITAIGILSVSGVAFVQSRNQSINSYVDSIDTQATIQLDRFEETMQDTYLNITAISCSQELKTILRKYIDSDREFTDGQEVSNLLKSLLTMQDYNSVLYLYIPETAEMFSTQDYYNRQQLDRSNILMWKRKQNESFQPLYFMNYFTGSAEYVFGYSCSVKDEKSGYEGYLCLTLDERQIYYNLLAPLDSNSHDEQYTLVTSKGLVCSAEDTTQLGCMRKDRSFMNGNRMNVTTTEENFLLYSQQSAQTGYYILCQSDMEELKEAMSGTVRLVIGILLFSATILVFAAMYITEQMYAPIRSLLKTIGKIREGDFQARVAPEGMNDEFMIMADGFNDLMDHIDDLMDHVVQERTEKREAEINALQYQIRPHFMYNTLNSIRFAAQLQRNQKLSELLGNFIELLEASIQRKGAFITIQEEIDLVKDFLALQAFRYFDCFETEFSVSPEAELCYVPCLLMQPLVENAVFHGVDTARNDNKIEINVWVEDELLRISIKDNGEGFEQKPEDGTSDKRRLTGIGLNNVRDRLQLYYRDLAFFTVNSVIGKGTTVEFTLPVSHDPEEYSIRKREKADE